MAGTDSRFDSSAFRDAIRFAMTMGLPDATEQRATFKWRTDRTFDKADSQGDPWTWTQTAASTDAPADVQVPVAVEFLSKSGDTQDTRFGEMDVARAVVTVMDVEYESLTQNGRFADQVQLDDAVYDIQFVGPPVGLFDVTVYSIHIQAVDEK